MYHLVRPAEIPRRVARLFRYEWRLQSPVGQCPCVRLTNKSLRFGRRCCWTRPVQCYGFAYNVRRSVVRSRQYRQTRVQFVQKPSPQCGGYGCRPSGLGQDSTMLPGQYLQLNSALIVRKGGLGPQFSKVEVQCCYYVFISSGRTFIQGPFNDFLRYGDLFFWQCSLWELWQADVL